MRTYYEYPFDRNFQIRLLAALVRKPKRFLPIIEPQFFTDPSHVEIARVTRDTYRKFGTGKFRLRRDSLRELLKKQGHSRTFMKQLWPSLREAIPKIFKVDLDDHALLFDQAVEFARDYRYREALVRAEKDINNRCFGAVHRRIDELRSQFPDGQGNLAGWKWEDYVIAEGDHEPTEWIVEGLIPANAITVFTGKRGDFKTYLALAVARAVARGTEFLGRTTYPTNVLYLNRDNPRSVFMNRLVRHFEMGPEDEDFAHWSLWHPKGEPPKLDSGDTRYREIAKNYKPLMIFDSLQRFHDKEENSATEMVPIFEELRRFTVLGAHVLLLHNLGKDEKRGPRGSSAIGDAADMLYEFQVKQDDAHGKTLHITVQKDRVEGREGAKIVLEPVLVVGNVRQFFIFCPVEGHENGQPQQEDAKKLSTLINDNPGLSQKQLIQETGLPEKKVRKLLEEGERKSWTTKRGEGKTLLYYPVKRV